MYRGTRTKVPRYKDRGTAVPLLLCCAVMLPGADEAASCKQYVGRVGLCDQRQPCSPVFSRVLFLEISWRAIRYLAAVPPRFRFWMSERDSF